MYGEKKSRNKNRAQPWYARKSGKSPGQKELLANYLCIGFAPEGTGHELVATNLWWPPQSERFCFRKIRAPIKIKSAIPPPPPKPKIRPPAPKTRNCMEKMRFSCRKNAFFPGVHKIGAAVSGPPELRTRILWTLKGLFLTYVLVSRARGYRSRASGHESLVAPQSERFCSNFGDVAL